MVFELIETAGPKLYFQAIARTGDGGFGSSRR